MADHQYEHMSYAESPQQEDEGGGGGKRKRGDSNATGRKRNRYISIACNECKRRKIKCNGETPCQRCGNLKLACVYESNCCSGSLKQSSDFKQLSDHVVNLENQIQYLLHNIGHLRSSLGRDDFPDYSQYAPQAQQGQQDLADTMQAPAANMVIDPSLQGRGAKPASQQSRFQGPTSPGFGLGLAADSLKHMGIPSGQDQPDASFLARGGLQDHSPATQRALHSQKDPIWSVNTEEALRLCRVFDEENGLLYPFLDIDQIMRHAKLLFSFIDAAQRTIMIGALPGADSMQDEDTDVLKLIMAIALVTEGGGQSERGQRLFEHVNNDAEKRLLGSVNLKDIQILTLTAIYHFHSGDEGLAWRVIGLTARLCLELGLHRTETYEKFPREQDRTSVLKLFWSVYVLDHRWSMGTGMSFALQDEDLDSNLPTPEQPSPYLNSMVQFSRIGAKVWKSVASRDPSKSSGPPFSEEDAKYLDYQLQSWYRSVPEQLHYVHPLTAGIDAREADRKNQDGGRGLYRLRCLLYLRQNQMRIVIYRPILHSAQSISSNTAAAQTVVDVAKDTINILNHLNQSSDIYRTQQMTWNHFLLSALAALTLAVCHAPQQFTESCKREYFSALELVRGLSAESYVSKRLWRTIRNLRELGPRLNYNPTTSNGSQQSLDNTIYQQLQPDRQQQNDAQRSAAMVMAGLATGQPVDESAFFADNAQSSTDLHGNITRNNQAGQPVTSPNGMANELTYLFEAAGALSGSGNNGGAANWNNAFATGQDVGQGQTQGQQALWPQDTEEVGKILRELY